MRTLTFAAILMLSTAVHAQTGPAPAITPEGVRAHVEFLADDLLEGRDAGTRGHEIAARYVATQFQALGLKPANGDSWYQQVPLEMRALGEPATSFVTIGGTRYANGTQAIVRANAPGAQKASGEAVFVGYGIASPENRIDDYAGLDVAGKTVVMLYGAPKTLPSDVRAALGQDKGKAAKARGAAAVITLFDSEMVKQYPWEVVVAEAGGPATRLAEPSDKPQELTPVSALLSPVAAEALFAGAPNSYKQILAAADKGRALKGFALKPAVAIEGTSSTNAFTSPNVVGVIPGSDPALAGEVVLLMAHLDHNGTRPDAKGEDKIFNGAMDNAAGTASMIEVARAFAASGSKPKRTVMFAAVTAEEDGLLGSQYLAKHPVGAGKVVSVVNLDMPILLYDFTDVVAFGAEHSTMGPLVAAAAAKDGVKLSPDPMPEENLFTRSDHFSFVQQGVPSVFLVTGHANGGAEAFKTFLATHYHKPSDDLKLPFNWAAGAKFARVNYNIARDLADAAQAPRWYADSPFGKQFAADAPKAVRAK
ncbi:M20/M25/M40 family metallo-hydrolase [Sphingomonas qomolangmaensis]|uniref:M20/M25/M40 family metallo-hydrolase n=1 Tax=Sphingomonas qomolangmaensis TaxID=2918765 RepID=A0ABY5LBU3_9SPHN|nr:M20/M25/M40 family metallo-hydrolase [Sphingomonas qomolangmaensis]UUL82156.1 M20/M25/M40 family metallo-hydrolase [Sphingomonas qomolangmaensis]